MVDLILNLPFICECLISCCDINSCKPYFSGNAKPREYCVPSIGP